MHLSRDNTKRYAGRVDVYRRYRARYPREVFDFVREHCGLTAASVMADVGSGTGMLAEVFLENGNRVFAIEPNAEMRDVCKELEALYSGLRCIDGMAEATTLPEHSVDIVMAGRAFHWFNQEQCRPEFLRILRPGGWVMLVNLARSTGPEPLLRDFQDLRMKYGLDYAETVAQFDMDAACRKFLARAEIRSAEFPVIQKLSYEELEGQTASFSVMPQPADAAYPAMQRALRDYFTRYHSGGTVLVPMDCTIYVGQLETLD
jgi:ubiquinone/menaquinone biosynthesis C-methylase UbiE